MGITVVSSPAAATASASANSAPSSSAGVPEGLPGGFAALLGSQLGRTIASNLGTATPPRDSEKAEEKPLGNENADQTLALLMAVPPVTPPVQPNQSVRLDTNIAWNEAANPQDAAPLLGAVTSEARGTSKEAPGLVTTDLTQQSSDAFKNALSTARDKQSETPTANIAAETAAQASAAMATAENRNHAAATPAEVRTHLQSPSWGQDFGNKVVWMAKNDQQSAQININPPQLGPVQITLQINGDQATAIFASPHTEVRQAIEGSLAQLRDMLATAGINLGQADVGANMARHNDNTYFQSANGNRAPDETAILPDIGRPTDGAPSVLAQRGRGLVDLFA